MPEQLGVEILLMALNIMVIAITGMVGYIVSGLKSSYNRLERLMVDIGAKHNALKDDLAAHKLHAAETFVRKDSMHELRDEILHRIDRMDNDNKGMFRHLEIKLDKKQDKVI
jgi:hypothetical protein